MEILLLDADPRSRRQLHQQLLEDGHVVFGFAESRPALDHFLRARPAVVIVEAATPKSEGAELCRQIRAVDPTPASYLLLRVAEVSEANPVALSTDADDFLADPVSPAELRLRLRIAAQRIASRLKSPGPGGNNLAVPNAAAPLPALDGRLLGIRLATALREQRLQAFYQPIVATKTGAVTGFEALVRWHDPEWGWVAPDRFLPLAEADGWMVEIGRQMTDLALRQLAGWQAAGHALSVSFNVSKQQLQDDGFRGDLDQRTQACGLHPNTIVIEVTERQAILHDEACCQALTALVDGGFKISLDDFGTGYSSFDMIAELPFHELKIDLSLGRKATTPRGRRILEAIVWMGNALGIDTVMEGVEDEALAEAARQLGTHRLQGYLFSAPMPAEATLAYLAKTGSGR
ncbi:MAG: EAL domain-containing response regulator [Limisphaerales bacterium]